MEIENRFENGRGMERQIRPDWWTGNNGTPTLESTESRIVVNHNTITRKQRSRSTCLGASLILFLRFLHSKNHDELISIINSLKKT